MKVLELFSGTQSISKAFRARGHETYTIELDEFFTDTDWHVDVMRVTAEDILKKFGRPDVIWASPPCNTFSVASIGRHWNHDHTPKTLEAENGLALLKHTIHLIETLNPTYYFIENPRGKMRKMPEVAHLPRYTVTYCQYSDKRMKPTDLWTNHPAPKFKTPCRNGDKCHTPAPRGSRSGTQGMASARLKAVIPEALCFHIVDICEE